MLRFVGWSISEWLNGALFLHLGLTSQWGVFYFVIAGMPYILEHEFGFNIQQTGLAFSSLT